uniref:Uncharacterized protein n=1 Tax=Arundo donax TaxID=35708 RepID=A0A0A9BBR9_ARUDO
MNTSLVARNPSSSSSKEPLTRACAWTCLPSCAAFLAATRSSTQP